MVDENATETENTTTMSSYLDFEKPIAEIEGKIHELRHLSDGSGVNILEEVSRLQGRVDRILRQTYSRLSPWQKALVARHQLRPHFTDYVSALIENFTPLAGDRNFSEDRAIIGGLAAVHQFCRIGTMSIIGGCSKVVQDVPPYMMADGNPVATRALNREGLKRNNISEKSQGALKQAHRILFRENLTMANAIDKAKAEIAASPELDHLLNFIQSSERGIAK